MKAQLVPGAELEFATPEDVVAAVAEAVSGADGSPDIIRAEESGQANAAGSCDIVVYTVPVGQTFILTRTIVDASGFTPGAPFNAAGAYLDILQNDVRVSFSSLVAGTGGGLPALLTDSESQAPVFRNGDSVVVRVVGGAGLANVQLVARIRGLQYADTPGV